MIDRLSTALILIAAAACANTAEVDPWAGDPLIAPQAVSLFGEELFALPVYDLYYKKRTTVGAWWEELDSGKDGNVTIAKYHQMNDLCEISSKTLL